MKIFTTANQMVGPKPLKPLLEEFARIFSEEKKIFGFSKSPKPDWVYEGAQRILRTAEQGILSRSYAAPYHVDFNAGQVFYSVGAHTRIMQLLLDLCVDMFNAQGGKVTDSDRLKLFHAASEHDMAEICTKDIADDGTRNENEKKDFETFYRRQMETSVIPGVTIKNRAVNQSLQEMEEQSSFYGRLLYVTDKASAILEVLFLDSINWPAYKKITDDGITDRDLSEMKIAENWLGQDRDCCLASEMWTIDYIKGRAIARNDVMGYIHAILIMATLICHDNTWYDWRERDYNH